jgi:hypothetical protein
VKARPNHGKDRRGQRGESESLGGTSLNSAGSCRVEGDLKDFILAPKSGV